MLNGSSQTRDDVAIVVSGSLAARQWEAHLAGDRLERGEPAWVSLALADYRGWAASLWSSLDHERPAPLTAAQSRALWRRIVAESEEGAALIGSEGAADWAARAWELLCNWRLDPSTLRGAEQPDFRALLSWCRRYREWLLDSDWIDHAQIDARLPDVERIQPPDQLVLADLEDLSPARTALLSKLEKSGSRIDRWTAPSVGARRHRIALADSTAEIYAAAGWLSGRLARKPGARVALIVPDLQERCAEVERVVRGAISPHPIWHSAATLTSHPLLGAALNAIELTSPRATFTTFSRWLRSPFFDDADSPARSARALLEERLRREIAAQLPFAQAYREAGFGELIRRECPDAADAIDNAFKEIGTSRAATPSRWAKLWQRALAQLGWPLPRFRVDDPALRGWEAALDALAALTPILGSVPADRALDALENILKQPRATSLLPLAGVHVLAHIDEVGPGYDAAWVTGFTDTQWPQPARSNPLLPRQLQLAHRMPGYSPQDARDRSARSLAKLFDRVPDLVISWPARLYDYATVPSPSIGTLPDLEPETPEMSIGARIPAGPPRTRETVADDPPALAGHDIIGGVAALDRQARCPLRAFCEHRLGARALESVSRGFSSRLQGVAAHRALQLLLQTLPSQTEIAQRIANWETVDRCVQRALHETFQGAARALAVVFQLERERLVGAILDFLNRDLERAAFQVAAVEQRQSVVLGAWTLRVRIDRLDRLADGSVAVIDYKTGDGGGLDWFKERLRDTQVPLYAVDAAESVAAAVIARVRSDQAGYTGIWRDRNAFPGNGRKLPYGRSWTDQLGAWRTQIEQLIEEFTGGDVRLITTDNDLDEARGAYAPLSRVAEQLALQRGSLLPW